MQFIQILQGINAALTAATELAPLIESTKQWVQTLFTTGAITAEQQNTLMATCNAHMNARLAGQRPPELVIDPE
ncbi:MAG: hypothetical protein E6R03_16535 [Hyphomicrobiaceae bacterium]|nr:MAG: hypothetical protein E6R03_16535 [Hyphomicrobiaceae bacterium]